MSRIKSIIALFALACLPVLSFGSGFAIGHRYLDTDTRTADTLTTYVDPSGYDREGFNILGYDREGFSRADYDPQIHGDGASRCPRGN